MLVYILFFVGFVLLIKSADWLVEGASSVANRLGVSALVVGLTIVSFGTSAPELVVNLLASLQGNADIAIGNIAGSNIANILLILGVSSLIYPLAVQSSTVRKEIPFSLLAIIVLTIMASDTLIDKEVTSVLSRGDGLVLVGFFAIFLYYVVGIAKETASQSEVDEIQKFSWARSVLMVVGGTVGLVVGGSWIVDGAVLFATTLGVSEALVGLTIVAVGTSLPELATSAVAAYRKNADIAIGNVVGSNIFNVFWILGVGALIRPLPLSPVFMTDLLIAVLATVLLFLSLFVGRRHLLERWQGGFLLVSYVTYISYLVIRG